MSNYPKRIYVLPAAQRQPVVIQRHVAPPPPPPPAQRTLKRAKPTEQIVAELLGDDMGPSGPRKRERLTHLTQEEKMDRRKMKNRMAAQNARDKKKERSGKIDCVLQDLIEENRRLKVENEKLRRQNALLQQQNATMQTVEHVQYSENNENVDANIYSNVVYEEEVVEEEEQEVVVNGRSDEDQHAFESAVFINAPLPWDKANRSSNTNSSNINQQQQPPRRMDSNKETTTTSSTNLDMALTILSFLINVDLGAKTNTSIESLNISRAHPEILIDLLRTILKKDPTIMPHLLQADPTGHLQKRVKHFRRIP